MIKLIDKQIAIFRKLDSSVKMLVTVSACAIIASMVMAAIHCGSVYSLLLASWLCTFCLIFRFISARQYELPFGIQSKAGSEGLADVYRATTEALTFAIAAKDSFEQHHVRHVQTICELVAKDLSLDQYQIDGIMVAALVHDVGKMGVPEYILLKPGPLDEEEYTKMRNHAAIGAKILENVEYPWDVINMVKHHHEKFDGTGYPDALSKEQIPLGARIIAVAEVYDSLISQRCYRDGWTHQEAVEHIEKLAGTHFDPVVVKSFLNVEPQIGLLCDQINTDRETASSGNQIEQCAAADIIAQANRELISLFEIAQTLSSTLELDEVLALLAHRTKRLSQAATCAVFIADEVNPQQLVARVAVGRYQEIIKGAYARVGKGSIGKAASQAKPHMGNYDSNDLSFNMEGHLTLDLKSCLVAPIVSHGEVLGTINLYDVSPHAFTSEDMRTLTLVASKAALAIQNASSFEKVRDSAMKDPLTGLYNGRYLHNYLEHELSRAGRNGETVSILGIDLDNFKPVNDQLGHQAGDVVLKDAAGIFQSQLRDYDLVVRNGGDEFVAVLPGVSAKEALIMAERIRMEIGIYSESANLNSTIMPLGVSVGVACYPDDAGDLETLLNRADAAMYNDKRSRKQNSLAA